MKQFLILPGIAGVFGILLVSAPAEAQLPPLPQLAPPIAPVPDSIPDSQDSARPVQPDGLTAPSEVMDYSVPGYYGHIVVPGAASPPEAWQPGGYSARFGRPYYYTTPGRDRPLYSVHNADRVPWAFDHSSYQYHFGPGYYRHSEGGHYRFPYYTYRAPWYFPGHPIYNRDTNRPW